MAAVAAALWEDMEAMDSRAWLPLWVTLAYQLSLSFRTEFLCVVISCFPNSRHQTSPCQQIRYHREIGHNNIPVTQLQVQTLIRSDDQFSSRGVTGAVAIRVAKCEYSECPDSAPD